MTSFWVGAAAVCTVIVVLTFLLPASRRRKHQSLWRRLKPGDRPISVLAVALFAAFVAFLLIQTLQLASNERLEAEGTFVAQVTDESQENGVAQRLLGSNAPIAAGLRRDVQQRIEAGYSDEEIAAFLASRYGDRIVDRPSMQPTWPVWSALILLGIGGLLFACATRDRASQPFDKGLVS